MSILHQKAASPHDLFTSARRFIAEQANLDMLREYVEGCMRSRTSPKMSADVVLALVEGADRLEQIREWLNHAQSTRHDPVALRLLGQLASIVNAEPKQEAA